MENSDRKRKYFFQDVFTVGKTSDQRINDRNNERTVVNFHQYKEDYPQMSDDDIDQEDTSDDYLLNTQNKRAKNTKERPLTITLEPETSDTFEDGQYSDDAVRDLEDEMENYLDDSNDELNENDLEDPNPNYPQEDENSQTPEQGAREEAVTTFCTGLRIKAYGPLSHTPDGLSFKAYLYCLIKHGASVKVVPESDDFEIAGLSERDISVLQTLKSKQTDHNVVIIHSPMVNYQEIIKKERQNNRNITVVGVHSCYIDDMNEIDSSVFDMMVLPSELHSDKLRYTTTCPTYAIQFPLSRKIFDDEFETDDKFVYYSFVDTVEDAELLMTAYLKLFHVDDKVLLYINSPNALLGPIKEIAKILKSKSDKLPGVLVHSRALDEETLHQYHSRGNVYVSVCRPNTLRLDALESILYGNIFIGTNGYFEEYIKCGLFIHGREYESRIRDLVKMLRITYEQYDTCKQSAELTLLASNNTETNVALNFCRALKKIRGKKEINL
jgi:hypothetical protein